MSNLPSIPWTERERAEFKKRLTALEAGGGGGGGATDLAYTPATRLLASSTGADVTLPLAGTDAGLMSAADKTKLNGVATGATANSADATLLDRANHTGTQDAATVTGTKTSSFISDFASAVAALITGKANTVHTHVATDVSDSGATGRSLLQAATAAVATAILNVFTSADKGLVPASGGGTTNFLRADGSWAAPAGGGGGSGPSPAIVWVL